jgi:hypothetical protein
MSDGGLLNRYTLTVPSRVFAGMLMSWAVEAQISATWDNPQPSRRGAPSTIVICFSSIQDRSQLLSIACYKIGQLRVRNPAGADRLEQYYRQIT